jgi:hypothetical protein
MFKICKGCKENKTIESYNMCGQYRSGKIRRRNRCSDCHQKYRSENWSEASPKNLFQSYKKSAKKRGLSFKLTFSEFLSFGGKDCNYCGEEFDRIRLDRIDNSIGYIITNVTPCCFMCNKIKGSQRQDAFMNKIEKIYLHRLG